MSLETRESIVKHIHEGNSRKQCLENWKREIKQMKNKWLEKDINVCKRSVKNRLN